MRNKFCYLIALLVLCAGCCHYRSVGVWTEQRKCVRVIDGDTIERMQRFAYEKGKNCTLTPVHSRKYPLHPPRK